MHELRSAAIFHSGSSSQLIITMSHASHVNIEGGTGNAETHTLTVSS